METERLHLTVVDESFAAKIARYYQKNRDFFREWDPLRPKEFFTAEHQKSIIQEELLQIKNGSLLKMWLFKKEDLNLLKPLGFFSFANIIRGCFLSCFLGYRMDGDEINKGYMTEALQKGIQIVFHGLRLHRIEANVMPRNVRSLKVLQKLGFEYEGRAKKYLYINGVWEDHLHMVLRNEALE